MSIRCLVSRKDMKEKWLDSGKEELDPKVSDKDRYKYQKHETENKWRKDKEEKATDCEGRLIWSADVSR